MWGLEDQIPSNEDTRNGRSYRLQQQLSTWVAYFIGTARNITFLWHTIRFCVFRCVPQIDTSTHDTHFTSWFNDTENFLIEIFLFWHQYRAFYIIYNSTNHCTILYFNYIWFVPTCFDVNLLKPSGHVVHQQFNIRQLYVLPTLYLCVLYLSENKQRLVPLTA